MNRRYGITLVEVLMSIFVMGIGLLGLMSLFPVAAMSMVQATQDDRATVAAANATSVAQSMGMRNSLGVFFIQPDPSNPKTLWPTINPTNWGQMDYINMPSYPLFIDPFSSSGTIGQIILPGNPPVQVSPGIRRLPAPFVAGLPFNQKLRWFGLLDDLTFSDNGLAASSDFGVTVQREPRYTWTYMLRRSRAFVPSETEMTIVVYNGRTVQLPPQELAYHQVSGSQGDNFILLSWDPAVGQGDPGLRSNTWVLDSSPTTGSVSDPFAVHGPLHSYFYRVVGVTPSPTQANTVILEVDTPLRADITFGGASLVIMDNVIEVFEKGTGWKP